MLTRNARWPGPRHGDRALPMKQLSPGEQLLEDMERFRHRRRPAMKLADICVGAGVDVSLIWRLRNGFNPRKDIEKKVRDFMKGQPE